jgi:hypothetical protein
MGDRGNIRIDEKRRSIYLYTHWGGSELEDMLRRAMIRGRDRWDDPAYLARIIFCEMLRGSSENPLYEITGLGISTYMCDNENPMLTVDVELQEIGEISMDGFQLRKWTFDEFITGAETNGKA